MLRDSLLGFGPFLAAVLIIALAGCASKTPFATRPPGDPTLQQSSPAAPAPSPDETSSGPRSPTGNDPVTLPAFEVNASALSDFGMSVQTNIEVSWDGPVDWMRVSAVAAESSAARANLRPGDRILAIDGQLTAKMDRTRMFERLFDRQPGARTRLLILGLQDPLPRFITLVARPPGR
jgi:membrane-associated protease RseP (regulator of RpoE activity)